MRKIFEIFSKNAYKNLQNKNSVVSLHRCSRKDVHQVLNNDWLLVLVLLIMWLVWDPPRERRSSFFLYPSLIIPFSKTLSRKLYSLICGAVGQHEIRLRNPEFLHCVSVIYRWSIWALQYEEDFRRIPIPPSLW